jgi:hypothetical protein
MRIIGCGLIIAMALACRRPPEAVGTGAAARDSAGVRIVLNVAPAWTASTAWTVTDTPSVDIAGSSAAPFRDIVAVIRTPAGAIAVADGISQRIRLFMPSGAPLRALGGPGTEPGEFEGLNWLVHAGDSLLAYDLVLRRLTLFGNAGRARVAELEGVGDLFITPVGRFRDGTILMAAGGAVFPFPDSAGRVRRDSATLLRFGADGRVGDTLPRVPWSESFGVEIASTGQRFVAPMPRPFGRRTSVFVRFGGFGVSEGGRYQVDLYGPENKLAMSIRREVTGAPVTPEAIDGFRTARASAPPAEGLQRQLDSALVGALDSAPYPGAMPVTERALADDAGNIWVQDYSVRGDQPAIWSVFDIGGIWQGEIAVPPRFDPMYISADMIYGVWRDPGEAPRVRGYRIKKP